MLAKLVILFLNCPTPIMTACSYIYEYFLFADINGFVGMVILGGKSL